VKVLLVVTVVAAVLAAALSGVRWLRVAQREHYLPGAVLRFARRWWDRDALHVIAATGAVAAAAGEGFVVGIGLVGAAVTAAGPLGLGLRGRTGRLRWTRRMMTVAAFAAAEYGTAVGVAAALGGMRLAGTVAVAGAVASPVLVEIALLADRPLEWVVARRYVRRAAEKLGRVAPVVVGITGSYGKTSTKAYAAHLASGTFRVVASPRSFNNRAGLARAVNETLADGTDVFIAEMGAYGAGEIADLVSWLRPRVSAITAIGPVHLERFGTLERTVAAKREIFTGAETAVVNVDDERLGPIVAELAAEGLRVIRCSSQDATADVAVVTGERGAGLHVEGAIAGGFALDRARPLALTNVACAVGIALALSVPVDEIATRLRSLPVVEHRLQVATSPAGVTVLDDTFNSNPAGARLALATLATSTASGGRRVVVTPGMVELGPQQRDENAAFARDATRVATDLVVVGLTNRRALLAGAAVARESAGAPGGVRVTTVPSRDAAVAWIRRELRAGDAVLYENDLPDQYP
jgi:UDP-N-acetylmuramoyl-tripeptide--D-alanyl-D-alanine ligase